MEQWKPNSECDLSRKKLQEVPKETFDLKNITVLQLDMNQLKSIPSNISQLSSLQVLTAAYNELKSLPEELCHIVSLTDIRLHGNSIETLPDNFGELANLSDLNLSRNKLKAIPNSFSKLESLHRFIAIENEIENFPVCLGHLESLTYLDISGNSPMKALPAQMPPFKNLSRLRLCNLDLRTLSPSIGQMENLQYLSLSMNYLTDLPEEMADLQALTSLDIAYNELTVAPPVLARMTTLRTLDVTGNPAGFKSLEDVIGKKPEGHEPRRVYFRSDDVQPSFVLPGLWLGPVMSCYHRNFLKEKGVTHVLSVLPDFKTPYDDLFIYHVISEDDTPSVDLKKYFSGAIAFIRKGIKSGGVLVHCRAGVSRSATMVLAYMISEQGISYEEALTNLLKQRSVVCPNAGFRQQLKEWQREQDISSSPDYPDPLANQNTAQQALRSLSGEESRFSCAIV